MKNLLLILILLCSEILVAQCVISGTLKDEATGNPVKYAHVKVNGTSYITTSDHHGDFMVRYNNLPVTIEITHVQYYDKKLYLSECPSHRLEILLQEEVNMLDTFVVSNERIVEKVVKSKSLTIIDYELTDNYMVFLGHKPGQKPRLVYMNYDFDTLAYKDLAETPEYLFKDCLDNIHLVTETNAFQVYYDSSSVRLVYPTTRKEFEEVMLPCTEFFAGKYYIKYHLSKDQIIQYFYYDLADSAKHELTMVTDEESLIRIADLPRLISMGKGFDEHDWRFEEMFFMDPIFAPLYQLRDSIYIFNFVDSKIEVYDSDANLKREIEIDFHLQKGWKEELYVDEKSGRAYTLFRRNGISRITEILLDDGSLGKVVQIPDFKFVDKISIRQNKVYFMYTNRIENENLTLYIMD